MGNIQDKNTIMPMCNIENTMKATNIFYGIAVFTLAGSFLILCLFFYYLFVPVKVIELTDAIHIHNKKEYRRGDTIDFELHFCKYKDLRSKIDVSFVNGDLIPALTTYRQLPVGCHDQTLTAIVPLSTHPDTYRIHLLITYRVNPVRSETYAFESEPFTIVDDVKPEVVTPKSDMPEGGAL